MAKRMSENEQLAEEALDCIREKLAQTEGDELAALELFEHLIGSEVEGMASRIAELREEEGG